MVGSFKREVLARRFRETTTAQIGMAVIEALLAYEWLLSGLNKCLATDYLQGLSASLASMTPGNPNSWYVAFLRHVAMPHCTIFGCLVLAGELLVAAALLIGAGLWLVRPEQLHRTSGRMLQAGVMVGLIGAVIMTANYYLMAGKTVPWLQPSDPYDEGLSLDGLLTLITAGLLAVHTLALYRAPQRNARSTLRVPQQSQRLAS